MRLIDAEEMIKRLQEWNTKDAMDTALFNFALHRILEQPTAYDVDEVVKQLNEKKENLGFIKTITDTSAYIKGINDAIKIGRAKMNTVQVTLSLYYEIVGADLYGGPESTGYAMMAFDFDTENLGSVNLSVMAEEWKAGFAKTCKVPVENITLISRCEYEDNTADPEGPDGVTEF